MENQLDLSKDEILRYDRHLRLENFGLDKQLKLKAAKVLIVGAGGLGCPIALYLAASGVGKIAIADDDKIEISNLQRQVAFFVNEIGQLKAKVLANKISQLNPLIDIIDLPIRIAAANVEETITDYDLVIDGTDNFATRFLIADACYLQKINYLQASVYQYRGQVSLFVPGVTPCFRCLFRKPPSSSELPPCAEAGILGVATGIIGSMAVTEAIKHITGLGNSITGKILVYDILEAKLKKFDIERDPECPLCSKNRTSSIQTFAQGQDKAQAQAYININEETEYTNCGNRLEANEQIISIARAVELLRQDSKRKPLLLDVREEHEYQQGHLEGAILWPLSEIRALPIEIVARQSKIKLKNLDSSDEDNGLSMVLCYCQRGARSLKAITILSEAGINNAFSLDGGIEAWNI